LSAASTPAGAADVPADDRVDLAEREERALKAAVDRVAPGVVRIETLGAAGAGEDESSASGPTSGLIVSEDGFLVTTALGFSHKPASILVTLADGRRVAARLVATDHSRMLAILKIDAGDKKLPVARAVPTGEMRVGQWAVAVGRTFDAAKVNASVGILSAVDRAWGKAVQTDAKVSPANYGGPLVDIRGRVLGILTPLSPNDDGSAAGVEWYDSGIGFAVPLAHLLQMLPRLKEGQDLHRGLMGVSFASADLFADPPVVAACRAGSPASKAGLKQGDRILAVDGQPVERQAQLRRQILSRYAGDRLRLSIQRGSERLERDLELVAEIPPLEHPFLGILPTRDATGKGVVVRFVYPAGPADKAGIRAGDRITAMDGAPIADRDESALLASAHEVGQSLSVTIVRQSGTQQVHVELARLPEALPPPLPPAHAPVHAGAAPNAGAAAGPAVGMTPLKLPQFKNECVLYVPEGYQAGVPHGLVVWPQSSAAKDAELVERWKPLCRQADLILAMPRSVERGRWQTTELEFVGKVIDGVLDRYHVDRTRIVVHGHGADGPLAYQLVAARRDLVRGVIAVDAPPPASLEVPPSDAVLRLAVVAVASRDAKMWPRIEAGAARFRSQKHPVTLLRLREMNRYPDADELAQVVRWIDALDRL
jgi:serine protease Do